MTNQQLDLPLSPVKKHARERLPRMRGAPLEKRFWAKVDIRGNDECWPWMGGVYHPRGYGEFLHGQSRFAAHRVAYYLTFGDIPDGLFICHKCDNPPCCNPSHLFIGTHNDNMQDMKKKGRGKSGGRGGSLKGEVNPKAKLNAGQVVAIRIRYAEGGISLEKLAAQYGTQQPAMWKIVNKKTWRHL